MEEGRVEAGERRRDDLMTPEKREAHAFWPREPGRGQIQAGHAARARRSLAALCHTITYDRE